MKRILRFVGVLVVLVVVAGVSLPFLIDANTFRPALEEQITKALGRPVKLGNLKVSLFSGGVTADELSVADDPKFSKGDFIHAKSLTIGVEMMPLITSRKLNVTELTVDQPEIALVQAPEGVWNFSTFGSKAEAASSTAPAASGSKMDLSVKLVKVKDGRLTLTNLGEKRRAEALEKVNVELKDLSATAPFPFTLSANVAGGGTVSIEGKAGPVAADATRTPFEATYKIVRLDAVGSGFMVAANGISGLASLNGTIASNGDSIDVKGDLRAENLKLAKNGTPAKESVDFQFVLKHSLEKRSGLLSRGGIIIGKAQANLAGTYTLKGNFVTLFMNLTAPQMPIPDLEGMLPALGITLPAGSRLDGGTASVKASASGTLDKLTIDGTVALRDTKLAGFDLGSKMTAIEKLAGIKSGPNTEIQEVSASVKSTPEGTTVSDIKMIAPSIGEISGAGTVSPSQVLDFKMRAAVRGNVVMSVLNKTGDSTVPFTIGGTASNPTFKADVKGMAVDRLKTLTGNDGVGKATGLIKGLLGKKN
jgi:AsmA protein